MCYVLWLTAAACARIVLSIICFFIVHASVLVANLYLARMRRKLRENKKLWSLSSSHRCFFSRQFFKEILMFEKWNEIFMQQNQKIVSFKSYSVDRCIPYKKPLSRCLEQHSATKKNEKKLWGVKLCCCAIYTHIRLSREIIFLLPHESWIYLCNSIPKKWNITESWKLNWVGAINHIEKAVLM